jgi:hypothetical protein
MDNAIVKETRDIWWQEIANIIYCSESSESAAEDILIYLEGEGAFTVVDD